jgi:hypothetical protein
MNILSANCGQENGSGGGSQKKSKMVGDIHFSLKLLESSRDVVEDLENHSRIN